MAIDLVFWMRLLLLDGVLAKAEPATLCYRLLHAVVPLIVLFLPWFAWRWSRTRSRHSLAVGATAAMTAFVQGIILIRSGRQASGGSLVFLPRVWVERVGGGWLFGDLPLPNSPVLMFFWGGAFFWCVATVALTVVALGRTVAVLWLLHFTLLAAPVFAYGYMPPPLSWQRHLVVPVAIVVVLLTAVTGARRPYSIAAAVSLAIGLAAMVYDFLPAPYPYRPDLTWLHQCVKNQSFICRQAIFGDGWSIEIVR